MKFLSSALSALILVFALLCGAALVRHVSLLSIPEDAGTQPLGNLLPETDIRDPSAWSLSKLTLFPQWGKKKSLMAVLVENHEEARPYQRGLEDAVLIEEFFVEGFISRFSAFFDTNHLPESIGPIRSLRPYFVDAALPWTSVFFHIGGSPEALERVETLGLTSFNGIYRDTYYTRKNGVPAPHDAFLTRESAEELLREVEDMEVIAWPPYTTGRAPDAPPAETIDINFFNPKHNVEYVYDKWKKSYIRKNGDQVSLATPRNVLVLETLVQEVGPFGRLAIAVEGEGNALLFRDGKMYSGRWSKTSASEPYSFTDLSGHPFIFASGQTWMTVVDTLAKVKGK
ncbi:hypothetical protein COU76_05835 [Candidatus Peregrinibacteria bacterium CG10_big_fil_rev_8_21_14_0_10_49_10]|nr:MAG: hypothetical protein COU76_05835 [Candidatus Peregrinibacteria bacterium CG10_big_fil_rev_8_21_14_0_10_49_10]